MLQHLRLGGGIDLALAGRPVQRVEDGPEIDAVALVGADCPGLRPRFEVAEGDTVMAGQPLFRDRARPEIVFAAPVAGRVGSIESGPRRTLSVLRLDCRPPDPGPPPEPPDVATPAALRTALLGSGLWPALRARPFGNIPDPQARPAAIVVTAIDTHPLAPDPDVVLAGRMPALRRGLEAMVALSDGPVYLCHASGAGIGAEAAGGVRAVAVRGGHPAGLGGHLVGALCPPAPGAQVWCIGDQDVADIGEFLATGRVPQTRIVALCGPAAARPRLLRTLRGASLRALCAGEIAPGEGAARLVSGPVPGGREAAWLGSRATQVTLLRRTPPRPPGALARRLSRLVPNAARKGPAPILPDTLLDRVLPAGIPAVPLMRALSTGDVAAAQRLGAHGLLEEDVALLSSLCTSGADYGRLLRDVLDRMRTA